MKKVVLGLLATTIFATAYYTLTWKKLNAASVNSNEEPSHLIERSGEQSSKEKSEKIHTVDHLKLAMGTTQPTITTQKIKANKISKDEISVSQSQMISVSSDSDSESVSEDSLPQTANNNLQSIALGVSGNSNSTKKTHIYTTFTGTTDMKEVDDGSKNYQSEVDLLGMYDLDANNSLNFYAGFSKQLTQARQQFYNNSKLGWTRSRILKNDLMIFSFKSVVILPTSEVSQKRDELKFALEFNPILSLIPSSSLSMTYIPRVVKNFHKYETNKFNNVLVEYQLVQILMVNYMLTNNLYVKPTLVYIDTVSYQGTERDDQFSTQLEMGYSYNPSVTLSAGLSNSGMVLNNELGPNKNIEIYNKNTSSFYGSMQVLF